jgi:hypothetical protein
MPRDPKNEIVLYGVVGCIGHREDINAKVIYVNCPVDDNPTLEKSETGSDVWISSVVEIRFIRKEKK